MNKKQFETWEKQKRREYGIELDKLREDFASRGLASSGGRTKAEKDLEVKYDSEIEIKRLDIEVDTTEGSKYTNSPSIINSLIRNNKIYGKNATLIKFGSSSTKTKADVSKQEHPFWSGLKKVSLVVGIIVGLIVLAQYFGYLPSSLDDDVNLPPIENALTATSTINIDDRDIVDNKGATNPETNIFIEPIDDKIRLMEFKISIDSTPEPGTKINEGTSVGLSNAVALFSKDETRYRFITDYQFTISKLPSGQQRLTLNYKPEDVNQLIGQKIEILKEMDMFVLNFSEFLRTIKLNVDRNKLVIFNWDMVINNIKVFSTSENMPASTILDGQAKMDVNFEDIEQTYKSGGI